MKPDKQGCYASNFIFALAIVLTILLAPFFFLRMNDPKRPADELKFAAKADVSQPPSSTFTLLPSLMIEADLRGATGALDAKSDASARDIGEGLTLQEATLTLDQSAGSMIRHDAEEADASSASLRLPAGLFPAGTSRINVERMSLQVKRPGGSILFLARFDGKILLEQNRIRLEGEILREGKGLALKADINAGADGGSERTLKLDLSGDLLDLKLTGQLEDFNGLRIRSKKTTIASSKFSELLAWLGLGRADGAVKAFKAVSSFDWSGSSIALDSGEFEIDGNAAQGRVTFNVAPSETAIDATLAFEALDLSPYVTVDATGGRDKPVLAHVWQLAKSSFLAKTDRPSRLKDINADLRLSAQSVGLYGRALGGGAAVVLIKNGKLQADLADVSLIDGANGSAQFETDVNGYLPSYKLRGKVNEVDLGRLTTTWFDNKLLDGTGQLAFDLDTEGEDVEQVLTTLSGEIQLDSHLGAALGLDLALLFTQAKTAPSDGWGEFAGGTSIFDSLVLDLRASRGSLLTEAVQARQGQTLMIADGTIRLRDMVLDMVLTRMTVSDGEAGRRDPQSQSQPRPEESTEAQPKPGPGDEQLRLQGPMTKPVIRYVGPPKKS